MSGTKARAATVVLAIGGHDPTGGAGIQADIEAIQAQGCTAVTLVTALTAQNTTRVQACRPADRDALVEQARVLLDDVDIDAIKIGLVPDTAIATAVAEILDRLPKRPVVCDPVLAAGTGDALARAGVAAALIDRIAPRTTVMTPNVPEALALVPQAGSAEAAAAALIATGTQYVLLTGTHAPTEEVENALFERGGCRRRDCWQRLPGSFHGSGCTLAAALAARLALGEDIDGAAHAAQRFTWNALARALRVGRGQLHPDRRA
ncbi:MAG: hydroxymethylpyrimidine/phosphomethylpyrimidine kinase [Gammaproteobacteria bacterium]